jgi:hypothetical protein
MQEKYLKCYRFGSDYLSFRNSPIGGYSASTVTAYGCVSSGQIFRTDLQHMTDIISLFSALIGINTNFIIFSIPFFEDLCHVKGCLTVTEKENNTIHINSHKYSLELIIRLTCFLIVLA